MEHQIYQALQGLGIITILFICFIVAASVETGRENDARRARAEKPPEDRNHNRDDGALTEQQFIAQTPPSE